MTYHLVFDATDPKSPRFIELENSTGHSISAGEWKQRKDGYAELVLPAPAGWQDIATAPRGGTAILLYGSKHEHRDIHKSGQFVFSGYWDTLNEDWCSTGCTWSGPFHDPTHWMPLPSPPKPLSYEGEQS